MRRTLPDQDKSPTGLHRTVVPFVKQVDDNLVIVFQYLFKIIGFYEVDKYYNGAVLLPLALS